MKRKNQNKIKPYLLVVFQFATLFGIMFTGPLFASGFVLLGLQIIGVILGIWSVLVMKIGNFNIIPVPVSNAELRIKGPYKYIRHPMYSSLLLFALAELINFFTFFRLIVFIFLIWSLLIKLNFEEKMLVLQFSDYEKYRSNSKRLIPFIY